MTADPPYLLCATCLGMRDWAEDPVVRAKGRQNAEYFRSEDPTAKAKTHHCGGQVGRHRCRQAINPFMKICKGCATRDGHCQHCMKPLGATDEVGAPLPDLSLERLIDLFTVLVKTYGYQAASDLLFAKREEIGGPITEALAYSLDAIDERIKAVKAGERSVIRMLFGQAQRGDVAPRCLQCPKPHRPPAMCRAERCSHWTHGLAMAWCLFCAVEMSECATCGVPTVSTVPGTKVPGTKESDEN